jgi:hypothetical protein|nr:MAG TPA: zinc-ribbon containing domain protein [Caudoviricetes sp.]
MASIAELLDKLKDARKTVELTDACGKRVCSSEEHWNCPYGNENSEDCVDRLQEAYEDTVENLLQLTEALISGRAEDQDLVNALRCISSPGGPKGDCKKCPFYKTELVPEDLVNEVGVTDWSSCDVDAVGFAAADQIDNMNTHILALQKEIEKLRCQVPRWIPVVHGLWEKEPSSFWRWTPSGAVAVARTTYRCGLCGRGTAVKSNYCPNCGAKMDGGDTEHPAKTRQSVFLELFPEAALVKDGVLTICPNTFSPVYKDERGQCKLPYAECDNCRRKFWLAEVE